MCDCESLQPGLMLLAFPVQQCSTRLSCSVAFCILNRSTLKYTITPNYKCRNSLLPTPFLFPSCFCCSSRFLSGVNLISSVPSARRTLLLSCWTLAGGGWTSESKGLSIPIIWAGTIRATWLLKSVMVVYLPQFCAAFVERDLKFIYKTANTRWIAVNWLIDWSFLTSFLDRPFKLSHFFRSCLTVRFCISEEELYAVVRRAQALLFFPCE